jgi:hypothetical protein
MSASQCAPFWAESPSILWTEWNDFYPFHESARICTSTALNSLTRFGIYLSIVLSLLYRSGAYMGLALGLATIAVAAYYGMKQKGSLREGFESTLVTPTLAVNKTPNLIGGVAAADKPVADVIGVSERTGPSGTNPFMNALVTEIKDNPTRGPAQDITTPAARRAYSDLFQTNLYGDPTDVFQHNQNQRTWVAQPSTSIPNDRESYQNWLYRVPGRTCKEGNNAACRTGTEGGSVTWLSAM